VEVAVVAVSVVAAVVLEVSELEPRLLLAVPRQSLSVLEVLVVL
jgi:hypothetical protein